MEVMINRYGMVAAPAAPQMFGNAGREHMEKYGKMSQLILSKGVFCEVLAPPCDMVRIACMLQEPSRNTLPKLPGRITSTRPTTRKLKKKKKERERTESERVSETNPAFVVSFVL